MCFPPSLSVCLPLHLPPSLHSEFPSRGRKHTMNICKPMRRPPRCHPPSVWWKMADTQSPSSSLFVNAACPLRPRRKSNWIADRMKKLIKPRGGGGGREGRALFTAAGSVENLADSADFSSDTHAGSPGEMRARAHAHTHTHTEAH